MGSSTSCNESVSSSIGSRLCLYSLNCEESLVKHEKSSYVNIEDGKEIFLEDFDSSTSEESDEDFKDSVVKELGISLCQTLHIHEPPDPLCVRNPTSNPEYISEELKVNTLSFDTDVLEGLSKYATVPCAESLQSYVVNFDAESGLSCPTVHSDNSLEADNLAFVQPPPMTKMPIPALKGSRAQHGIRLDKKLTVKWAPEVYDPPVTSSSHTVKGHHRHHYHHRSKAKKDHHSHKYSRGKSSKSNVPERKHSSHRRSCTSSPKDSRILRSSRPQPMLNSCGQSKIEPLDLAVGNHGGIVYGRSSCYMELLAPAKLTSF